MSHYFANQAYSIVVGGKNVNQDYFSPEEFRSHAEEEFVRPHAEGGQEEEQQPELKTGCIYSDPGKHALTIVTEPLPQVPMRIKRMTVTVLNRIQRMDLAEPE